MTSLQRGTQVPVTHLRESHPTQTFDGSQLLNVFAEQPIPDALKGPACQRRCQIPEKDLHKHGIRL